MASENPATEALVARPAQPDEVEAFVEIARTYVNEEGRGQPFDERAARFVFAGLARADPMIALLKEGSEVVGFSLTTTRTPFFCGSSVVREDLVFVRADKRCAEAELRLHAVAQSWFELCQPTEAYLFVPPTEHCQQVYERLVANGYWAAGLRMTYPGPAPIEPQDTARPASLH